MRRDILLLLGLATVPMIALAQSQPTLPGEPIENDMWANANQVSNALAAPPFDPEASNTLSPAREIERPELRAPRF